MLFSDMEGSTSLLSRLGDRYGATLDIQRSVLRSAWRRWGGTEMGTEGDSFFVVFEGGSGCCLGSCPAQRAVAMHRWPHDVPLRVRMGIHTGSPMRHAGGYVGMDVHRAARVGAVGHGGQVVVSEATARLVQASLPGDVNLVDRRGCEVGRRSRTYRGVCLAKPSSTAARVWVGR
jgi:class 3 adenylate cyclase